MEAVARLSDAILAKRPPETIREHTLEIVSNDDFVADHEPNIHPLGFIHTKVGTVENVALRLHLWPEIERPYQEPRLPIHDHIWRLDSHLLTGRIENRVYDVAETAQEPTHRVYQVSYGSDAPKSILRPTETTVRAGLAERSTYTAGDHYSVGLNTYHASRVPADRFTATIVATTEFEERPPKVLGPVEEERFEYHRRTWEARKAERAIDELIATIR